jgi:hypothetical protein
MGSYRVSFWGNENVLELDNSHSCTILMLKTTETVHFKMVNFYDI